MTIHCEWGIIKMIEEDILKAQKNTIDISLIGELINCYSRALHTQLLINEYNEIYDDGKVYDLQDDIVKVLSNKIYDDTTEICKQLGVLYRKLYIR